MRFQPPSLIYFLVRRRVYIVCVDAVSTAESYLVLVRDRTFKRMSYSQFTNLEMIETNFGITIADKVGIFANLPKSEYSDLLSQTLQENISLALAINTEKARSELIITPVLLELRRNFNNKMGYFSGNTFNIDELKS